MFEKLFPSAVRLAELGEMNDALRQDRDRLSSTVVSLNGEIHALKDELAKRRAEDADMRAKVREQTEADLYLTSAKIMRDILEKGKPEARDVAMQSSYQNQLSSLGSQSAYYPFGLFGSAAASLAGGGVFRP